MADTPAARCCERARLHLHAMVTGAADYRHYYMSALGLPAATMGHSHCASVGAAAVSGPACAAPNAAA